MQASIAKTGNGVTVMQLDEEALTAVRASIVFAAKFNDRIAMLAAVTREQMEEITQRGDGRTAQCR